MKDFKLMLSALICCVGLAGIFQSCSEDETEFYGSVYGFVTGDNGDPIQTASITLSPTGKSTTSGSDGRFEYRDLEAGQYSIQVVKSGYQTNVATFTIVPGQSTQRDIVLKIGSSNLAVDKTELNFSNSYDMLTFDIVNNGQSDLKWQIQNSTDWIQTLNPSSGTTTTGQNTTITVTINRSSLENGKSYEGFLIVTSNAGDTSITVKASGGTSGNEGNGGGNGSGNGNINSGLYAYYTFDNENCDDVTINTRHGNPVNSPSYVTDTPSGSGKALFLNASQNQYVNIPYYPFQNNRSYSVSFWVKGFDTGMLFSCISNDQTRSDYPRLYADSNGDLYLYIGYDNFNSTPPFSYNYNAIQDNKWHMITVTVEAEGGYSRACTKKLYVDGRMIDSAQDNSTESSQGIPTKIQIGGDNEGKGIWNGNGTKYNATSMYVDNFRIYTRVLSENDVKAVYTADLQ